MIQQKKKPCKYHVGQLCYLFSHGMCKEGYSKMHPSQLSRSRIISKPKKKVIQDDIVLSEKEAFRKAYLNRGGVWFLTGEKVPLDQLTASNFAHVLPKAKNKFPLFKYYWKNIVILSQKQHDIFDKGDKESKEKRIDTHPKEHWVKLFFLVGDLQMEYAIWEKEHPGEYKL